mmetsp:Transcript_20739/g.30852  ORF Transcript_20739/g.30852 Transcript_20739/m.30852 type:complete len:614 (+) Transcript_20739:47-1888(+)
MLNSNFIRMCGMIGRTNRTSMSGSSNNLFKQHNTNGGSVLFARAPRAQNFFLRSFSTEKNDDWFKKLTLVDQPKRIDFTVRDVLRHAMKYYKDRTCLISTHEDHRHLKVEELDDRSTRLANTLRTTFGVAYRELVGVLSENSTRYVEIYFANAKLGATTASVAHMLRNEELVRVINNIQCRVLFVSAHLLDNVLSIKDELEFVQHFIVMDGGENEPTPRPYDAKTPNALNKATHYEQLLEKASSAPIEQDVCENDIFTLFLTSGTTGIPKCVMKSHRAIMQMVNTAAIPGDDIRCVLYNNFAWIGGTMATLRIIQSGGTVISQNGYSKEQFLSDAIRYKANIIFGLPAIMRDILHIEDKQQLQQLIDQTKLIAYGGGLIPAEIILKAVRLFKGTTFMQMYGQTESGMVTSMIDHPHNPTEEEFKRFSSAGKVVPSAEVRVVDPQLNQLEAGQNGEIVCRSDGNMVGYFRNPDATKETMVDGWLRTGDSGYFDKDGYLFINGRVKDMIVVDMGINVYPKELEDVIEQLPGLKDVTVVGISSPHDVGEKVVVFVVKQKDSSITAQIIENHCKEHLADYKQPHHVEFVDAIPYNENGKPLKRILQSDQSIFNKVWK